MSHQPRDRLLSARRMDGKGELVVLGLVLMLLGFGICVVTSIGFIDKEIIDLPLGPAERDVERTSESPWAGPITGLAMFLVGVILVSVSAAERRPASTRDGGEDLSEDGKKTRNGRGPSSM